MNNDYKLHTKLQIFLQQMKKTMGWSAQERLSVALRVGLCVFYAMANLRKTCSICEMLFCLFYRFLGKHESLWNEEKLTLATNYIKRHKSGIRYSELITERSMYIVVLLMCLFLLFSRMKAQYEIDIWFTAQT